MKRDTIELCLYVTINPKDDSASNIGKTNENIKKRQMKQINLQKQENSRPSLCPSLSCFKLVLFAVWLLLPGFICIETFGQIPVINTPTPNTHQPISIGSFSQTPNYGSSKTHANSQLDQYEKDKRELQQRNVDLYEALHKESAFNSIQYDLPSHASSSDAESFRKASETLNRMLSGAEPMNLKLAIFTIESAYLGGKLNYQKFDKEIQDLVTIAKLKAAQDGYNWENPQTRNIMLFRVMADTLKVKSPSQESFITSYPMQYDFDDYMGKKNWSNMFVSKLLASKSGQCHSLPLLYLILCEETGTQANLAFSPSHSYAKFKDQTGNWHNLELTNGRIVSDAFILGSGYVTAEALKNRIYMEPLTKKQTIAQCLADLAKEYTKKYGYDGFVSQCVDTTLKYDPTNIFARQVKSDYQTLRFDYVVNQIGRPHPEVLKVSYPKVYQLLEERNQTYQIIDASGYQEMPEQAYQEWLNSVNKEKEKQEHQGQMLRLTRSLK
jgi:hypothetical protein